MRSLVATGDPQRPLELRQVDERSPADNHCLVEVKTMSTNRGELRLLASRPARWRPGQDKAGVVTGAAADGTGPPVGTRVAALVDQAGWAERAIVPSSRIGVLPAAVSFGSIMSAPHARLSTFFVYQSGESPALGADISLLAGEIAAGRLQPQVGLETSWGDPLGALEALRQRSMEGKAVLRVD